MQEEAITNILKDYVTETRCDRLEEILAQRTRYLTVLLEDIYQPQNASAVLRTCDCFGVQDVHIIETFNQYQVNPMVVKGADKWLTLHKYTGYEDAVSRLRTNGYRIIATSLHADSKPLHELDLGKGKCALVFGNEHRGVSGELLEAADEHVLIPMYGFTQSLNISVSAGIALHYLTGELKKSGINLSLSQAEKTVLMAQWLQQTVKKSELILNRLIKE
ncbi:MAG: RNA methyltransferase [Bacteroidales bacterium]|jgi:tRNA (guanosine-2'-O-)-methyltransferase|nr:RNA methyltransferase [Bacteroidales bacterium]